MRLELDFPVIYDRYQTPFVRPKGLARYFPSLVFYGGIAGIVKRAARLAKRNNYADEDWCLSSYNTLKALESVGAVATIEGVQSLVTLNRPSIIIGNHMSTLETFLLPYLICPHQKFTFVVKQSLISYPVFKHVMISRNPIVVGRSNPKQDFMTVLNEGIRRLEEGYSVVVFPQTTRMLHFDKSQFNSIGIKLAKRAKAPIIPLALKTDFWGNGTLLKDMGRIDPRRHTHVRFGSALSVEGNGKHQQESVISHIENCLSEWNLHNTPA